MAEFADTQSRIETVRGPSFPYQFGMDLFRKKVIIFRTTDSARFSIHPDELQRKANDMSLDPHRRAMYAGAWEYYQSQQRTS